MCWCAACVEQSVVCFPGCHGEEEREEGQEEGGFEERVGRKEEYMSVGESTESTVHVYTCRCNMFDVRM